MPEQSIDADPSLEAKMRIHRLPIELANQIAAGEVIERPSSVLKELLENSIDAGSTQINIEIKGGGLELIAVRDNGHGICKDDLILALTSHATSKIHHLSDLERIQSYGFRGEALASISAVSRLCLSSAPQGSLQGWRCERQNQEAEIIVLPAAQQAGTQLEVRDLFYNVPARRAFLRPPKTESLCLEDLFKRVALSQPSIRFQFQMNERPILHLPACTSLSAWGRRVARLCGQRFIETAVYIEAEAHGLILKGWVGSRSAHRAQADLQYFYVNGRIVRDKVINHAIRQAYGDDMPSGRYATYVLYFELPPQSVDVNVHPTKHEVRFREARLVHNFLVYALNEGLKQQSETSSFEKPFSEAPKKLENTTLGNMQRSTEFQEVSAHSASLVLGEEFLFAQIGTALQVFDLKKSHRLWLQKILSEQYQNNTLEKRHLLWPQSIHILDPIESVLGANALDWDRLGFDFSPIGPHELLLRSVPYCYPSHNPTGLALLGNLFLVTRLEAVILQLATHIAEMGFGGVQAVEQFFESIKKDAGLLEALGSAGAYKILTVDDLRRRVLSP